MLLKNILDELVMAHATVSRALNNHLKIVAKSKKKEKPVSERLDYYTNKITSFLGFDKTEIIDTLIPTIEHLFLVLVIHAVSNPARKEGYEVLVYESNKSGKFENRTIDKIFPF